MRQLQILNIFLIHRALAVKLVRGGLKFLLVTLAFTSKGVLSGLKLVAKDGEFEEMGMGGCGRSIGEERWRRLEGGI